MPFACGNSRTVVAKHNGWEKTRSKPFFRRIICILHIKKPLFSVFIFKY
jgi:hypothetical protein